MAIRRNFIYPTLTEQRKTYGANFFSRPVVNPSGDWRKHLPPYEEQRRFGVEPSTCFLFAQLHADATFEEFVFNEVDNDYAERFPAQFAGGTPNGGDPLKGSDAIYDHGSVPESSMPFDENITSWEEYTSWQGVDKNKVITEGEIDTTKKGRYGVVIFERDTPLETKYMLLDEAMKRGVVCISVWGVPDGDTYAEKPEGVSDTHMVEVTFVDRAKKQIHILDTYTPLQKILPAGYNPDFGMVRYVEKKSTEGQKLSLIESIIKKIWLAVASLFVIVNEEKKTIMSVKAQFVQNVKDAIGTDASPQNIAPQELSCAEGVSNLIATVFTDFPHPLLSTAQLKECLDDDKRFVRTLTPSVGTIIVSPRTETVNGHAGVFVEPDKIVSNDSGTGYMRQNYSYDLWIKTFKNVKKLRIILWDIL